MQQDLLATFPDAPFQVYVVWMPALSRDSRASWDPHLIDDRRELFLAIEPLIRGPWHRVVLPVAMR